MRKLETVLFMNSEALEWRSDDEVFLRQLGNDLLEI